MALPPQPLSITYRAMTERWPGAARRFSQVSAALLVAPALVVIVDVLARPFHPSLFAGVPTGAWFAMAGLWILGTPWLALHGVRASGETSAEGGRLEVADAGRLRIHQGTVREEHVVSGIALTTVSGPALDLHLGDGREIRALVGYEREAQLLLERLGLGRGRRRVVLALGSEGRRIGAGFLGFVGGATAVLLAFMFPLVVGPEATDAEMLVAALIVVAATFGARRYASPAPVVVGAEGVVVGKAGSSKLITFAEIESVSNEGQNVVLDLHRSRGGSGQRAAGATRRMVLSGHDAALATGIVDRIREGMAAARGDTVAIEEKLDPDGRTLDAWREALAGVLRAGRGYRGVAIGEDDLLAVVEDAAVPARRRIGAALALRVSDHAGARARVQTAADACADDEVRAALEGALADEVDEVAIRRVMETRER